MSRQAIAAVLARQDLSSGERLAVFSLASFADRDGRARPGTPAAAGRAALKKSWFLEARDSLERRGLVVVEDAATGRGRASTLWLPFAAMGPWWDGEINAELFEAVLSYSRSQGNTRLLLAALAALADERRVVEGVTSSQLRAAAGFSDRTYRRAQAALLSSEELLLRSGTGGRGNTNLWELSDPRLIGEAKPVARRRVTPPPGQRPLLASVASTPAVPAEQHGGTGGGQVGGDPPVEGGSGGGERTVSGPQCPVTAGVSGRKGSGERTLSPVNGPASAGDSVRKGGADRTVSAETPAETPAPNARAGREPQNPRTLDPPSPPEGGSSGEQVLVEQTYVTERGRRRRRVVAVDLGVVRERLRAAGKEDLAAWERVRTLLRDAVGESTFEFWLAPLELIAVDLEGTLLVSAQAETVGWVARRFGRILDGAAHGAGRRLRVADEVERKAAEPLAAAAAGSAPGGVSADARLGEHVAPAPCAADTPLAMPMSSLPAGRCGRGADQPASELTYPSDCPSSYADVYTPTREVS